MSMADRDRADRMFSAAPGFAFMLFLLFCAAALRAQTAPSTAQTPIAQPVERPGDVYKELMRPLEQVRSSVDNWSPAELAALAAGIKRAQEYCEQVAPASVHGDDLYQLARICSVGQQWNAADVSRHLHQEREPALSGACIRDSRECAVEPERYDDGDRSCTEHASLGAL
jgi:hypothetical protein